MLHQYPMRRQHRHRLRFSITRLKFQISALRMWTCRRIRHLFLRYALAPCASRPRTNLHFSIAYGSIMLQRSSQPQLSPNAAPAQSQPLAAAAYRRWWDPLGLVSWIFPASQPASAPAADDAAALQGSSTVDSLERLNALRNAQAASFADRKAMMMDLIHRADGGAAPSIDSLPNSGMVAAGDVSRPRLASNLPLTAGAVGHAARFDFQQQHQLHSESYERNAAAAAAALRYSPPDGRSAVAYPQVYNGPVDPVEAVGFKPLNDVSDTRGPQLRQLQQQYPSQQMYEYQQPYQYDQQPYSPQSFHAQPQALAYASPLPYQPAASSGVGNVSWDPATQLHAQHVHYRAMLRAEPYQQHQRLHAGVGNTASASEQLFSPPPLLPQHIGAGQPWPHAHRPLFTPGITPRAAGEGSITQPAMSSGSNSALQMPFPQGHDVDTLSAMTTLDSHRIPLSSMTRPIPGSTGSDATWEMVPSPLSSVSTASSQATGTTAAQGANSTVMSEGQPLRVASSTFSGDIITHSAAMTVATAGPPSSSSSSSSSSSAVSPALNGPAPVAARPVHVRAPSQRAPHLHEEAPILAVKAMVERDRIEKVAFSSRIDGLTMPSFSICISYPSIS